jgi:D-glycero-D-manno-heptose 1,7-bisphosphate phosphatase
MVNKAIFLDRDGVINVDHGYVHKVKDFQFIDGIFEFCHLAVAKDYLIIVITNQAGIGRGYYTEMDLDFLTNWMCKKFFDENLKISKMYFSPYHPVYGLGKYKKDEQSRKPNPGMIQQAVREFRLDLNNSVLIGDKVTDIQAGQSAGVKTNILYTGSNRENLERELACHCVSDLKEAQLFL